MPKESINAGWRRWRRQATIVVDTKDRIWILVREAFDDFLGGDVGAVEVDEIEVLDVTGSRENVLCSCVSRCRCPAVVALQPIS